MNGSSVAFHEHHHANSISNSHDLSYDVDSEYDLLFNVDEDSNEEQEEFELEEVESENDSYLIQRKEKKIQRLNTFKFKNVDQYFEGFENDQGLKDRFKNCPICINDFSCDDSIIEFNCKQHVFHKKCILTWLEHSTYCPICKKNLLTGNSSENKSEDQLVF